MGQSSENMQAALLSTGLYSLGEGSLVAAELDAYDAAFSIIEALLRDMEAQVFVQTATGDALAAHEKLVGLGVRAGLPDESRRDLVCYRRSVAASDFTLQGMLRSMRAAGLDAAITEHSPEERLTVQSNSFIDAFDGMDAVKARLSAMLPAHLDWEFDTGVLTWDMFDAKDPNWDAWDAIDFSWDIFDIDGHNLF
ncbi:MAG: YmfQ family protein [Oscillospiraceae bacterium]|jgi:hypothetical protein|nr:YmfQ family protein [Oscillospiraceae bacterium]